MPPSATRDWLREVGIALDEARGGCLRRGLFGEGKASRRRGKYEGLVGRPPR